MMKKLLALLLTTVLVLALFAACASDSGTTTKDSTESVPAEDVEEQEEEDGEAPVEDEEEAPVAAADGDYSIGLVQIMEHPSLNTIRESFMAELEVLGYGGMDVDYASGQGDMSILNTIVQKFVGDEVDAIVAIATPSAIAAAGATKTIPVIFSAATDPVAANLLEDPEHPDANVTGVSDAIPVDRIFGLAAQLTPDAKTFGFVYNLGEPNSVSVIEEAKAYCDANGLEYLEATVANTGEVQIAAQSLVGKVDAFFTPIDNTVADAMPIYAQVGIDNKIPVYTGADSMVEDGGFATYGIDYTVLGQETARMLVAVLEGTPIADLPVVTMTNFRPIANQATADALGIDLSVVPDLEIVSGE